MSARPEKYGTAWSRDELILAFELYCRIPFRATKASNQEVQRLAGLLDRSPAGVARKLGNFGAFDPALKERNISGLVHTSRLDGEIWDEFHRDWPGLVSTAQRLRVALARQLQLPEEEWQLPSGPSERVATARQRLHQAFFRQAVLSSYERACCVTGIQLPEVLVASHIVPWSVDHTLRADPTNGLCLSATFDRLFDSGLMSIDDDLSIRISRQVLRHRSGAVANLIGAYHRRAIRPPTRFLPRPDCLRWQRENVFLQ
jgi:predicted restriction endonuclease